MKFEEIETKESYIVGEEMRELEVIIKDNSYRIVVTQDKHGDFDTWREEEVEEYFYKNNTKEFFLAIKEIVDKFDNITITRTDLGVLISKNKRK